PLDRGHHGADRGQRTRAGQYHPQTPQRQDGRLGLAQLGQILHDSGLPLVTTGLARHSFPPWCCGFLSTPQDAIPGKLCHFFENSTLVSTPRSSMSSSTWRVLSGYATYQRTPIRITSGGKWAPLKLIAIIAFPHDARLLREEDDTSKRLK